MVVEEKKLLRVSVSPHIHSPISTRRIMLDVILALVPALLFAIWLYGLTALLTVCVSVASCVLFEYLSRMVMKRPQTIGDLSAVVTGILLAFTLPANLPFYMVIVGAFISIVVAKQCFGGIGNNFVNPALIGRIALSVSFAKPMSAVVRIRPDIRYIVKQFADIDVLSAATPMQSMKGMITEGKLSELPQSGVVNWQGAFLGFHPGSLGEVSVLFLLIGFAYLLFRGVVSWVIPLTYVAGTFVLSLLLSGDLNYTLVALFSGGLFLGALFMATDYTTSPITKKGQFIFGLGCALLTSVIRYFGAMPEAVAYSIVLMNLLVPYINGITKPLPFGASKAQKKPEATR